MAVETVAGTTIGISAGVPATFNAAGYAALTYSTIGEITDGGSHGRVYAEVTHMPISTRGTQKFKGSFNEGNKTLQLAISAADAGQVLARAALLSDNPYAFKVTYQGGAVDYFQARVMSFDKATAGVDSILTATVELSLTTSAGGVGIVEVP
jgi:Lambda phage tail tube protein, TTP